ncbi:MAG TPA: ribonuclease HI family protein [Candidatus Thermoplasmatota archaeon]|nr:ribonuclease HI family protein [Candidatus Thermoplasmatota archaeon]
MVAKLLCYTDGASRGNPGAAGIGFLLVNAESGGVLAEEARSIGVATNNEAEYRALVAALEAALAYAPREVAHYSDSELLVRQLNGQYRLRAENLRPLLARVEEARTRFERVSHAHVPRTHPMIARVDAAVNRALDRAARGF